MQDGTKETSGTEGKVRLLDDGNLFLGRFDDILARPEELLRDTLSFLGVRDDRKYIGHLARTVINATGAARVPEQHRPFLEDLFRPEMKQLEQRFGFIW